MISDRLQLIINELYNGNKSEFARTVGISINTLANYLSKERSSKPSSDVLENILNKVNINAEWLVLGKGEMIKKELPIFEPSEEEGEIVPIYSSEASAGLGNNNISSEFMVNTMRIPFARHGDIALPVVGDSMAPVIRGGDLVIIREFKSWKDYIPKGKEYVVVTDDSIYVKVVDDYNSNAVKLLSYNKEYREFEIPIKLIKSIYLVIGLVSQRSYAF